MIVILNNGTRIRIDKDTVANIAKDLLKERGIISQWQCILNPQTGEVRVFNLLQVSAFCTEEDILPEPAGTLQEIGLFLDTIPVEDSQKRWWVEEFRRFVTDKKTTL